MNLSQKEKLELRKKIPQQIKDYLASTQKVDIIFELGEKNQLSTQEISIVSDKVTFVLYGLISSTDLEQNLTSSLKISEWEEVNRVLSSAVAPSVTTIFGLIIFICSARWSAQF